MQLETTTNPSLSIRYGVGSCKKKNVRHYEISDTRISSQLPLFTTHPPTALELATSSAHTVVEKITVSHTAGKSTDAQKEKAALNETKHLQLQSQQKRHQNAPTTTSRQTTSA
eukprot:Pompholyxophrys_sp_v1_NODE_262_length_945_cov_1.249438.p2 type:complete len:113 gc:universal NODE_262_length_945_cov_1.249438:695-357(-)